MLFFLFALFGSVTAIVPFATMYASLKSNKYDLSIGVLILISFLTLFRMDIFRAAHGGEVGKKTPPPSLKSITHILQL